MRIRNAGRGGYLFRLFTLWIWLWVGFVFAIERAEAIPCYYCPPTDDQWEPSKCDTTCTCPPGQDNSGCSSCTKSSSPENQSLSAMGMPSWWISEPRINLRLEDVPLGYRPARGLPVAFHLSYRQRGVVSEDPAVFSAGPNWSFSFRAFVYYNPPYLGPELHSGGGGLRAYDTYNHTPDPDDGTVMTTLEDGGFQLTHRDGQIDIFDLPFTNSAGNVDFFMTSSSDPVGSATTYTYAVVSGVLQLIGVTDPEGNTTQLYYENATYGNLVTRVVDPFSRTCLLRYDNQGYLTNIVDTASLSSYFAYDAGPYRNWITNLSTPYGNTGFSFGGTDATNETLNSSGVSRFAKVHLPTGGQEMYLYQGDCPFLYDWSPGAPNTAPFPNDFAENFFGYYNSYYWGPLQFAGLSTVTPTSLTTDDYERGRLRHWLVAGAPVALGLERAPSSDGATEGQSTWYDYEGRDYPEAAGNSDLPSLVAKVLPDGTTHFSYSLRGLYLTVTNEVETFSLPDGSVGLRTNAFIYADNGIDLLQWVGPNSEQVVGNYFAPGNTSHQPNASTDALGQTTYYTYNSNWQLTSVLTPAGLTTTNLYYTSGAALDRLKTSIALEIKLTNSYTYYNNGLVQTHTDGRNMTSTLYWDNLQRLTGTSYPDGSTISNLYTYLDLTATKDRDNYWTYFGYNAIRQKVVETNAIGTVTAYDYCDCGALYAITNAWNTPAQLVVTFDYDNQGNRTHTWLPDESITNWFDSLGRVILTGDSWGYRSFGYNNQGLLHAVTNGAGPQSYTIFDREDRPLAVTDANQVTVTNAYDLLGRLLARGYPDGGVERFGYSPAGLAAYTNQLNYTNFFSYDAAGRKVAEMNANGELLLFTNAPAGELLSLTDGKGQTTQWRYDIYGRATNKLDQLGASVFAYQYDGVGRLTNRWSAAKGNTQYRYDGVGDLLYLGYPVTHPVTFKYDALSRLTNMLDEVGTTVFAYTSGGELFTEDGPFASDTVTNVYTHRLRTGLGLAQPAGYWLNSFAYDDAKRLYEVASPAGTFDYARDLVRQGLVRSVSLPNTSYITNWYDGNARLLGTVLANSSGTALDSALYGYNAANERIAYTNAAGTYVHYSYDPIGQLKVATSSASGESRGYAYDAAWNPAYWTNGTGGVSPYVVDGKNELTNYLGTYKYDASGNPTNLVYFHNGTNYTYDDECRLESVTPTNGLLKTTFLYDGLGRMREQFEWSYYNGSTNGGGGGGGASSIVAVPMSPPSGGGGGGTGWSITGGTFYVYDGNRVIQERYTNNTPTVTYTRGLDLSGTLEGAGGIGGLLARSDNYSGGTFSRHDYYHADGNGNITYLADNIQGLAASYRYDPYGNLLSSSGTLAADNTYRFSSREYVPSIGLYAYLYRFYNPGTQRWLNQDPIGEYGGENLFMFCGNDPLARVDHFGLAQTGADLPVSITIGNTTLTCQSPAAHGPTAAPGNNPPATFYCPGVGQFRDNCQVNPFPYKPIPPFTLTPYPPTGPTNPPTGPTNPPTGPTNPPKK